MKAVQQLPIGYKEIFSVNLQKDKKSRNLHGYSAYTRAAYLQPYVKAIDCPSQTLYFKRRNRAYNIRSLGLFLPLGAYGIVFCGGGGAVGGGQPPVAAGTCAGGADRDERAGLCADGDGQGKGEGRGKLYNPIHRLHSGNESCSLRFHFLLC